MASHPAHPQLGLFDNPVRVFSLDELAETVRKLERERPGRTVEELSGAVFTELAIKRTRRAADLVAEAIRLARPRQPGTEITGSQWQASTSEVRNWALSAGFELGADGTIPGPAITAYNQIHPGRPYLTDAVARGRGRGRARPFRGDSGHGARRTALRHGIPPDRTRSPAKAPQRAARRAVSRQAPVPPGLRTVKCGRCPGVNAALKWRVPYAETRTPVRSA